MDDNASFGYWLRRRRKAHDLTQADLARRVGCSAGLIRMIEADTRRPSRQIAELLAEKLAIPADQRAAFVKVARGELAVHRLAAPAPDPAPRPPPDTLPHAAPSNNLPHQLTSFIGRENEIAAVWGLLTHSRLVTLTGVGGVGKTRLALQVAATLPEPSLFPDGVWLIELAPLADPALVPQTVAGVLGINEQAGQPMPATLINQLRDKAVLLVLDNCEHLIAACAQFAQDTLHQCPQLHLLVTSREALSLLGEMLFVVPALSTPNTHDLPAPAALIHSEAVRLFVERASAAQPGFALTQDNAPAVVRICRKLDGLPLAIELAAARVKVLEVAQIAARLDDRFRLLTGGSRTALPRHQTLQALIDWSYDLLPASEQLLLQHLAVFVGGSTLEAAEAVAVHPSSVLELLTQLVNKSLVMVEREPGAEVRYGMLETIRQYALAKLEASGELDSVRQAHAAYFLSLVETNRIALAWYGPTDKELDNLRAALTWSLARADGAELALRLAGTNNFVWGRRAFMSESRRWQESALARADVVGAPATPAWTRVLEQLGFSLANEGNRVAAQARWEQCQKLYQELGDLASVARLLEHLGWLALAHGDGATARLRLMESLALAREIDDQAGIGNALNTLAGVAILQEDPGLATGLLEESLALHRRREDANGIGWALNQLGQVAQLEGEYVRAKRLYEESQSFFRENPEADFFVELAFGDIALAQGEPARATKCYVECLTMFRDPTDRRCMSWCLAGLAGAAALGKEPERAARLWGAAEALRQAIGGRRAPAARATDERLMTAARQQLGDIAFGVEWGAGQALTVKEAIALALDGGD